MYINTMPVLTFIFLVGFVLVVVMTLFIMAKRVWGVPKLRSWLLGAGLVATAFLMSYWSLVATTPKVAGNDSYYAEATPGWIYVPLLFVGFGFCVHAAFRTIVPKRDADDKGAEKQPKLARVRTSRRAPKGDSAATSAESSSILGFTGTNN